ncbi:MAG: NAD(P)/FAD-dependent oxidoreductase [Dehalococcoidia bacterium]
MDDVLVLGAGPAGNNTALQLAERGYKVTVVDRTYTIGDKLCTGIVGAECLRHFPADESQVLQAAISADVYSPSGASLHMTREAPQAYVLDRVAYVEGFANRARRAGASYRLGYTLQSLSVEADGVSAIVVNGAGPEVFRARAAVVASGFGSGITRMVGLGQVSDYVTGIQAEVNAPAVDRIEVYVGRKFAPGFFAWLVPTSGGRALLGLLARRNGEKLLQDLLAELQDSQKVTGIVKPPKRWGIPLRTLAQAYRDRVLVVGDAAGQVKPATGGGIYYSLLSSQIAAETLHRAIPSGDLSAGALSAYEKEWRGLLGEELEMGYNARRLFELLGDRQIDFLFKTIGSEALAASIWESPSLSFDWHSGFIRHLLRMPIIHKALSAFGILVPRVLRRVD